MNRSEPTGLGWKSLRTAILVVLALLLIASSTIATSALALNASTEPSKGKFTFMTRNLYFGFAEQGLLTATTPDELIAAAAGAWSDIERTDLHARARAIAGEIVASHADLVGLQEAVRYELSVPNEQGGLDVVDVLDYVDVLLAEISILGGRYDIAASVNDTDVTLPIEADFSRFVRLTDRDVILVRSHDLKTEVPVITGVASANYQASVPIPTPLGDLLLLRGWVAVDVEARGHQFRFISTHLEDAEGNPDLLPVQMAQAEELLAGPANVAKLPVILVADSNSDAERNAPTYELLTTAGFVDSWRLAHPRSYGFTCCQSGDLTGEAPAFYQRVDLILYRGELRPRLVMLVGEDKVVPLEAGTIWPSDHAGLCAVLEH